MGGRLIVRRAADSVAALHELIEETGAQVRGGDRLAAHCWQSAVLPREHVVLAQVLQCSAALLCTWPALRPVQPTPRTSAPCASHALVPTARLPTHPLPSPPVHLPLTCTEQGVFFNHLYDSISMVRDNDVKDKLRRRGVACTSFNADVLYEPWEVLEGDGTVRGNLLGWQHKSLCFDSAPGACCTRHVWVALR